MAWQIVNPSLDLLEQVGDIFIVKGQRTAQEGIKDNAAAPHIDLRTSVQLPRYHL